VTTEHLPDRFLDLYPDHLCTSACAPPCHISCAISRTPISAANRLFIIGEDRYAGFSAEAFHVPEWEPECRANAQEVGQRTGGDYTEHLHWWSIPLELLGENQ